MSLSLLLLVCDTITCSSACPGRNKRPAQVTTETDRQKPTIPCQQTQLLLSPSTFNVFVWIQHTEERSSLFKKRKVAQSPIYHFSVHDTTARHSSHQTCANPSASSLTTTSHEPWPLAGSSPRRKKGRIGGINCRGCRGEIVAHHRQQGSETSRTPSP